MTSRETARPHLVAAVSELGALACAVRPDWTVDDVTAALMAAHGSGMTWAQTVVGMARLIVDLNARPGELVPPHRDQQRPERPGVLGRHAAELDKVREDCANAAAKLKAEER